MDEPMPEDKLRLSTALLSTGWHDDVLIGIDDKGFIQSVDVNTASRWGKAVKGIAVPGMANVHSHAHQRAMAGLAEVSGSQEDSFWTWRQVMYGYALKMKPDELEAVAAELYVEALKAGFTSIGEFQYLHHAPDGTPYSDPAELSLRCLNAAKTAGIAITLLPTLYTYGGFGGAAPQNAQRRFINDADSYLAIVTRLSRELGSKPLMRLGISPHSLRAVTPELLREVLAEFDRSTPDGPVHIHAAEQGKEVEECIAFTGKRPVEYLLSLEQLSQRWCLIHATHMNEQETDGLAASRAIAGLCPTTEANLGDGIFNGQRFLAQGGSFAIGSDSHISVSVAEELRQFEYSQRLKLQRRNVLAGQPNCSTGRRIFEAAASSGARCIAQPQGAIKEGLRADIVVLDSDHPSLIGRTGDSVLDSWIFSGGNACVKDVFVGGRHVVKDRQHVAEQSIARRFAKAIADLRN
jgi:formimidoylglutamate deiminase